MATDALDDDKTEPVERRRERLAEIMEDIHDHCAQTADEYGLPGNFVAGANIGGFARVADVMSALGIF